MFGWGRQSSAADSAKKSHNDPVAKLKPEGHICNDENFIAAGENDGSSLSCNRLNQSLAINVVVDSEAVDPNDIPELTDEQGKKLDEMHKAITAPLLGTDDNERRINLIRFLRARKFVVEDAAKMYDAMVEWRRESHVDDLMRNPDPNEGVFQSMAPHIHHGHDKFGHPVYYERTGLVRVDKMLQHVTFDQVVERHVRLMEYLAARCRYISKVTGKTITKTVSILDMGGLVYTVESSGLNIFKKTTNLDKVNYPETMFRTIIINAPITFRACWRLVRPWLDPVTAEKITIVGGHYQKHLLQIIDEEDIPTMYGGRCQCNSGGDGNCLPPIGAKVAKGGTFPGHTGWDMSLLDIESAARAAKRVAEERKEEAERRAAELLRTVDPNDEDKESRGDDTSSQADSSTGMTPSSQ